MTHGTRHTAHGEFSAIKKKTTNNTFELGDARGLARYALWVLMVTPADALSRFGFLDLPPPP